MYYTQSLFTPQARTYHGSQVEREPPSIAGGSAALRMQSKMQRALTSLYSSEPKSTNENKTKAA